MTDAKRWQQLMGVSLHRCFSMESYVRFGPMGLAPHWPQDFIDTILNPHDLSVFYTKYCTDIIGSEDWMGTIIAKFHSYWPNSFWQNRLWTHRSRTPLILGPSLMQFWILMIYQCSTPNIAWLIVLKKIFKYLINFTLVAFPQRGLNCRKLSSFGHLEKFLFLVMVAILDGRQSCRTQFWKRAIQVWSKLAQCFLRRRLKCEKLTTDETWWQKLTWPLARWAKKCKIL